MTERSIVRVSLAIPKCHFQNSEAKGNIDKGCTELASSGWILNTFGSSRVINIRINVRSTNRATFIDSGKAKDGAEDYTKIA